MIIGTGIDIVSIKRIEDSEKRWGRRFLNRVFTEMEIKYAMHHKTPHPRLAARFAAKEAMVKALGTGFTEGIVWKDIEVLNRKEGRPEIILHGKARETAESIGVRGIHISISHDGDYAVVQVVLES